MKRTKLVNRQLPRYTKGEEIMNMVTHIVGGSLGIFVLLLCLQRSIGNRSSLGIVSSIIYGVSMVTLYSISSIYHGLRTNISKKVMQVLDHCMIYLLIAGTYTPILLISFTPSAPLVGWGLLGVQWSLAALAATFTAIDLKKYNAFSMICYILMGWGIIFFLPLTISLLTPSGFYWLLAGGIVYTIGAVLYGVGVKLPWMHSVFHIFVVLGSLLQFLAIYFYVL